MVSPSTVRIFISSPSDVRPERLRAEQIIARLDREFAYHFRVESLLWEREPLVATRHFQDTGNIPEPRGTDIVVVILWTRLGVPLPADKFRGAVSGEPVTGTEWEFEDALAGARRNGRPDLLLYRKEVSLQADLSDRRALEERLAQLDLVERFVGRWFKTEDGRGFSAASHGFATATDFEEKLYDHLRALLHRRAGAASDGVEIRWHGPPFRGLAPFGPEHAQLFFGRTEARNRLRETVARLDSNGRTFILVLGASGSGKSSLVRAGLLPDLRLPGMVGRVGLLREAVLKPSDRPADLAGALASALLAPDALPELAALRYTPSRLAGLLGGTPDGIALPIEQGLAAASHAAALPDMAEARLVLVLDQLEELFTAEAIDASARAAFADALDALARTGLVWIVATLRSDFYDRLEDVPALARLAEGESCFRLLPPDASELAQIVRRPAREAGVRFGIDETRGTALDDVILAAARDSGALPLLSFLLDQLWQRRTAQGELTMEAYRALGGLEGALGRHAETIFASRPEVERAALPRLLRALVTVESGQGAAGVSVAARVASLDRFPDGSPERALADAFLDPAARLLTTEEAEGFGAAPRVRVAHEALLTHWQRAHDWIAERPGDLQREDRIEAEAARWAHAAPADRTSLLIAAGLPLGEAEDLLARRREELTENTVAFIETSVAAEMARQAEDRRRIEAEEQLKRQAVEADAARHRDAAIAARDRERAARQIVSRTRVGLAVACLLALVAAGLAWLSVQRTREAEAATGTAVIATGKAEAATSIAETRLAEARLNESRFVTERAAQDLLAGHPELAGLVARAALPDDLARPDRPVWAPAVSVISDARAADRALAVLPHGAFVATVALSPDGTLVATASSDRTAGIWDATTGLQLLVLSGHSGWVTAAAFSPDGARVVTSSLDDTARVWDAHSGVMLFVLAGHTSTVDQSVYSPDGRQIATASKDSTARIWDAASGKLLAVLRGHTSFVNRVAWSPDGHSVATASNDGTARVWDVATGTQRLVLPCAGGVNSVAWSPDGASVLTASNDNVGRLWDATTGEVRTTFVGHTGWVNRAAFSPDGRTIATASQDRTARLWDANSGRLLHVLDRHQANVIAVIFSADGRNLVTTSADTTARLWDVATGAERASFLGHEKAVFDAAISPDARRVFTASSDNTARIWNAGPMTTSVALAGHTAFVRAAAWSPDGRRIATASDDHTIRIWNASDGAALATLVGHADEIETVEWSSDGKRVLSSSKDKTARIWDATTGAELLVLAGHSSFVSSARYSPDGRRVATSSYDSTIRFWDAATGAQTGLIATGLTLVLDARWSPDGLRIASADSSDVSRIWNAATGVEVASLKGHESAVETIAWSPDGTRLATGSLDGTARVWDAATGAPLHQFGVIDKSIGIVKVAWSPDGQRLAASSPNDTSRVWNVGTSSVAFEVAGWDAAFSPDGLRIIGRGRNGAVHLADAATGAELALYNDDTDGTFILTWAPDSRRFVTGGRDATSRIWPVWPLSTEATVTYHDLASFRVLTQTEREALFLDDKPPAAPAGPLASDAARRCDLMAGDPDDPSRTTAGVALDDIDDAQAGIACRQAVDTRPDDATRRYELGRVSLRGGDPAAACASFQTAADKGSIAAMSLLGDCFAFGTGQAADVLRALDLYHRADAGGYAPAALRIGNLYWTGSAAVPQNRAEAFRWFKRGAEGGDTAADLTLGWIFHEGSGVDRNEATALGFDLKALKIFRQRGAPEPPLLTYRIASLVRALGPVRVIEIARNAGSLMEAEQPAPHDNAPSSR